MKKPHWLRNILITLVACGIVGLILSLILFFANPGRTGASCSIEFSFDGAAEGKAPNGYRYDLSGFTSEEVLSAALMDVGLSEKYTVDQISANILVSGVYPENIVEQMTKYESLLTGDASKVSVADYHATLYNVTLYNDFDKSIAQTDLEKLLAAIMTEFRAYFEKTYSVFLVKDSLLDSLSDYDYPQQLEILEKTISRNAGYAEEMADAHPDFLLDNDSFSDILAQYKSLLSSDLERLNGLVTMNALSKDQERIVAQYENRIRVLQLQLKELDQEAKDTEALIKQYNKDDIIYVSTSGALQRVGSNSSDTYDVLVVKHQEITEKIADLNKELDQVKLKLRDIEGDATEENEETGMVVSSDVDREAQKTVVEKGISSLVNKLNKITENFTVFLKAYSEREMNDRTVAITEVKYKTPKILSGAFIKKTLKTAGPICALGFIVCLVCVIISRKKEGI